MKMGTIYITFNTGSLTEQIHSEVKVILSDVSTKYLVPEKIIFLSMYFNEQSISQVQWYPKMCKFSRNENNFASSWNSIHCDTSLGNQHYRIVCRFCISFFVNLVQFVAAYLKDFWFYRLARAA